MVSRPNTFHPRIVGEFDDSALMKAFGKAGTGAFPAPSAIESEVTRRYGTGRRPRPPSASGTTRSPSSDASNIRV